MFAGINGPPGALISRSGELTFEGFCAHCSAPFITNTITGNQLGVYIDDMTPHRKKWCIQHFYIIRYHNMYLLVSVQMKHILT